MRLTLEVTSEPQRKRRIWLDRGQSVDVGRTERSFFVFPHDRYMSSRHFQIQSAGDGWLLTDLESTHGTTLNGTPIQQEPLRDGDRIGAGSTKFRVHLDSSSPLPEAEETFRAESLTSAEQADAQTLAPLVGAWAVRAIPAGWQTMDDQGLRTTDASPFPFTLMVSELSLPEGVDLQSYAQLIRNHLDQSTAGSSGDAPRPLKIEGADEAYEIVVSQENADTAELYQRQVLARKGNQVGMATLTATAAAILDGTVQLDQLDQSLVFGHESN